MPLEELAFTGLVAREDDNRIPFEAALKADDCYTDTDAVTGRNGTRSNLAAAVAATGSGQHLGRFRPSITSARIVMVIAGEVWISTDPTSDVLSDGTKTSLGTPFSSDATISGAQLGTSYYLSTDQNLTPWVRINWTSPDTYTLETLSSIPGAPDALIGSANTTLNWTLFTTITPTLSGMVLQDNTKTGFTAMDTAWRGYSATDNGNDDPAQNSFAQYKLNAAFDATGYDWLAVAVSPHDASGIGTQYEVTIQVAAMVAGSPGPWTSIGSIYDVPPVAGSPNLIYCDLRGLPVAALRSQIRYIKLLLEGASGGKFISYGFLFLPARPVSNPGNFYIDFLDVVTGEFSVLSAPVSVTVPQAALPPYSDSYMGNDVAHSSGAADQMLTANPRIFNQQAPTALPDITDIGGLITITFLSPTFTTPASLQARLWEDTENGRRLVATKTVFSATSYSFTVGGGASILANQLYKAGGTPPRATCITAHAQRLVGLFQNRCYISSFVPTSDTSNPFPQWPSIATEDADGWSFDFFPSSREVGVAVNGDGDALYLISSESWYFMSDLTPNSPVFQVFKRGGMDPQAAKYIEDRMFVGSWDGVYMGVGRSAPIEMSEPIRRIYQDWLRPGCGLCIGYDPNARALFVFQDARFLRYRFPTAQQPGKWTRGTLAHKVPFAAWWTV